MPIYETVCVLHPELSEARVKDVIEGMQKTLEESQARLLQVEEWGLRNLAYDIQKQRRGYYVRLEYEALPQAVKDFERGLRLSEDALRFLSVARSTPSDGQSPIPPGALTDRSAGRPLETATKPTPAGAADPALSAPAENSEATATETRVEAQEGDGSDTTEATEAQTDSEEKTDEE